MSILKVKGRTNYIKLTAGLIVTLGVGFLSSIFTGRAMDQYKSLAQPPFAPPSWLFAPVWTILYILMALAAYRVWMYGLKKRKVKTALILYAVQLVFNFLWSILFFTLKLRGPAFLEILVLLLLIVLTTVKFFKIDKKAAYLMIPYILWVSFAAVLNYSVWQLNR